LERARGRKRFALAEPNQDQARRTEAARIERRGFEEASAEVFLLNQPSDGASRCTIHGPGHLTQSGLLEDAQGERSGLVLGDVATTNQDFHLDLQMGASLPDTTYPPKGG
jgi:hypothetical protein